jgi:hypothetical protein
MGWGVRITEYWIGIAVSVGLDISGPDHLAPLLGLIGNDLAEVGGRTRNHCAAQVSKARLDLRIGEARVDLPLSLSMLSAGVFFGAPMPFTALASYPGTNSATVGVSGSASERAVVVTASARSR